MTWLCVALGAAVGAPLRFLVGGWLDSPGPALPWGTLTVNTAGSFVLGLASVLALGPEAAALIGVGFCGGLTTYSTFAVQTVGLGRRRGAAYAALTVGLALVACTLGHLTGAAVGS